MNSKTWYKLIFLGGIINVIISIFITYNTLDFKKSAVSTQGKVVENVESGYSDNNLPMYKSKIVFSDENKKEYTFYSTYSSNPPQDSVGDILEVFYNPNNPQEARLDLSFWGPIIIFFMGLSLIIASFFIKHVNPERQAMFNNFFTSQK